VGEREGGGGGHLTHLLSLPRCKFPISLITDPLLLQPIVEHTALQNAIAAPLPPDKADNHIAASLNLLPLFGTPAHGIVSVLDSQVYTQTAAATAINSSDAMLTPPPTPAHGIVSVLDSSVYTQTAAATAINSSDAMLTPPPTPQELSQIV
jgi:citrate lyase gamma subunit